MVDEQLAKRDITDHRVLSAMAVVPRHRFVPAPVRADAYDDRPLPIDAGQTFSQPYIVAFSLQALDVRPGGSVLDVGTGSGYQAAILSFLGRRIYTIDRFRSLVFEARAIFEEMDLPNITAITADGSFFGVRSVSKSGHRSRVCYPDTP